MVYDTYSFTAVGLGFILVATFFYFFIVIIQKARIARNQEVEIAPFIGLALMFLCFALVRLALCYNEFYDIEYGIKEIISYKLAIFFGYCMFICFIFFTEKILKKTKYVLTILNIICCIYGIIFINTHSTLRLYTYITTPILGLILLINYSIILIAKTKGIIRQKMATVLVLFVLWALFYVIDTVGAQEIVPLPEEIVPIVARSGQLFFGILWGYFLIGFETFTEFDWPRKLKDLYLINNNGINLYHYSFSKRESLMDPDLISAGLSGMKDLIAEIIKSEDRLKTVDHQDLKLILEYGEYVTIALIVSENLRIYHSKLTILMEQFEKSFQDILSHWSGDIEVFIPAQQMIQQVFELKGEDVGEKAGAISSVTKKFFLFSMLLLAFTIVNAFILFLLDRFLWQPIWSENMVMYVILALALILGGLIPIWWKYKIYHKMQLLKTNIESVPRKILYPSIFCTMIAILGALIYLVFGNVSWAVLLCATSGIGVLISFLIGLNFIAKLELSKNS